MSVLTLRTDAETHLKTSRDAGVVAVLLGVVRLERSRVRDRRDHPRARRLRCDV